MEPTLLLGVDGGGQATQAAVATATGELLGRGLGPPSNYHRVGLDNARRAVKTAIEAAFAQAHAHGVLGTSHSWITANIGAAFLGLSGIDGADDSLQFTSWLKSLGCTFKITVGNNAELVLGGGTPEGWGVALISGTGSICIGRAPNGATARVGGWGHVLGDDGSGYQLAAEALKLATLAADDRGGSSTLLQAALHNWGLADPRGLVRVIRRPETTAEDIGGFASRVLDLAARNDASARELVDRAAAALASQVDAVIRRLKLKEPPVAVGGSLMRISVKKAVLEKITSPIGPVTVVSDPVQGAIATARRMVA